MMESNKEIVKVIMGLGNTEIIETKIKNYNRVIQEQKEKEKQWLEKIEMMEKQYNQLMQEQKEYFEKIDEHESQLRVLMTRDDEQS